MKVIRAVGDYAVIELKRETTKSGILTRLGNVGRVVSCRKDREIEGKSVAFSTRPEYQTMDDYVFVPYEMILCVVDSDE